VLLRRLIKRHGGEPRTIVTNKLRSYGVTLRKLILEAIYDTSQHANNRAELPHQPTRVRERGMRRFNSRRYTVFRRWSTPEYRVSLSRISPACPCVLGTRGSGMRYWGGRNFLAWGSQLVTVQAVAPGSRLGAEALPGFQPCGRLPRLRGNDCARSRFNDVRLAYLERQ
jgi:hypothetical protein